MTSCVERAAHSESSLYDTTDKSHEQNESPVYVEYFWQKSKAQVSL